MTGIVFFLFPFLRDSESAAVAAAVEAVRMQMGPVTPTVINKAGFVGVLSPAATRL